MAATLTVITTSNCWCISRQQCMLNDMNTYMLAWQYLRLLCRSAVAQAAAKYSGPSLIRIAWDQSPFRLVRIILLLRRCVIVTAPYLDPLCFWFLLGIPAFAARSQNTQNLSFSTFYTTCTKLDLYTPILIIDQVVLREVWIRINEGPLYTKKTRASRSTCTPRKYYLNRCEMTDNTNAHVASCTCS